MLQYDENLSLVFTDEAWFEKAKEAKIDMADAKFWMLIRPDNTKWIINLWEKEAMSKESTIVPVYSISDIIGKMGYYAPRTWSENPLRDAMERYINHTKTMRGCGALSGSVKKEYTAHCKIFQCDVPLSNGHVYPKEVMEQAVKDFNLRMQESTISGFGTVGDNYLTDPSGVPLGEVTHKIESLTLDDDSVLNADIKIYDTPKGKMLTEFLQRDIRMVPALVGYGETDATDKNTITKLQIQRIDLLSEDHSVFPGACVTLNTEDDEKEGK